MLWVQHIGKCAAIYGYRNISCISPLPERTRGRPWGRLPTAGSGVPGVISAPSFLLPCDITVRLSNGWIITVMSHGRHTVWNHWQNIYLAISLFWDNNKENTKSPHYWPFVRGIIGRWIYLIKGQWSRKRFHVMKWVWCDAVVCLSNAWILYIFATCGRCQSESINHWFVIFFIVSEINIIRWWWILYLRERLLFSVW